MRDEQIFGIVGPELRPDWDDFQPCDRRVLVLVTYGRNGGATAKHYTTGERFGRASGGGYDITAEALAQTVTKLYGVPSFDGARGLSALEKHCKAHGVHILSLARMLHEFPVKADPDTVRGS